MVSLHTTSTTRRLLAVICVLVIGGIAHGATNDEESSNSPPSIDILPVEAAATKRAITLDDMVSLREIHEPRQSPDGHGIAFLVKQAFRRCDCYRTALYFTTPEAPDRAQKLTEEDYIVNLQWSPDGRYLSYLSSKGGSVQLWHLNPVTHRSERIFMHTANRDRSTEHAAYQSRYLPPSGVLDYRWSPNGTEIAFTTETPSDPTVAAKAEKEGFRYDDTTMNARDLMVGDWVSAHRSKQLWLYDVREKRQRMVWATPSGWFSRFTALSWRPDGQRLAFFYSNANGADSDSLGIVDTLTSKISQLGNVGGTLALASPTSVAWLADGRAIVYLARSAAVGAYKLKTLNISEKTTKEEDYQIYPGHIPWIALDASAHRVLFLSEGIGPDRQQTGIYSISENGGEPRRLTGTTGKVDDCDVILNGRAVCVRQAVSVPPRAALIDIANGSTRDLTEINPEIASVELAPVRELRWKNVYGEETNGYLIMPTHRAPGMRLPLVAIGYAFSGEFVTQANTVLTTYPAQAFARDGIAVLLFNYPRFEGWRGPNFERGSRAFGYGPVSSIQAAIELLDAEGLIDPRRVGMMGHSLAGFWAQLAITQTNLFKVVEFHNGGTVSEPGMYWENGSKQSRELQEQVMGGPPYGATLKNYLGFSMTLNADRIHAPVLMEYDSLEALPAMEYYEAMRRYDVPVDFFVYPNDGHVTERPEHRFVSLQRNLDWFEFWLLGKENDPASKSVQYGRWRQLRTLLEANAHRALTGEKQN